MVGVGCGNGGVLNVGVSGRGGKAKPEPGVDGELKGGPGGFLGKPGVPGRGQLNGGP